MHGFKRLLGGVVAVVTARFANCLKPRDLARMRVDNGAIARGILNHEVLLCGEGRGGNAGDQQAGDEEFSLWVSPFTECPSSAYT
jgi:hypothetical protein